jgi:hypothetical protein
MNKDVVINSILKKYNDYNTIASNEINYIKSQLELLDIRNLLSILSLPKEELSLDTISKKLLSNAVPTTNGMPKPPLLTDDLFAKSNINQLLKLSPTASTSTATTSPIATSTTSPIATAASTATATTSPTATEKKAANIIKSALIRRYNKKLPSSTIPPASTPPPPSPPTPKKKKKKLPNPATVAATSTSADKEFIRLNTELERIEKNANIIHFNPYTMAAKYQQSIAEIGQLENNLKKLEATLIRSNAKKERYNSGPEPIFESDTIKDFISKNRNNIKGFQLKAPRFKLNGKIYKKDQVIPYAELVGILDRLPKGYILTNANGNSYFHNG